MENEMKLYFSITFSISPNMEKVSQDIKNDLLLNPFCEPTGSLVYQEGNWESQTESCVALHLYGIIGIIFIFNLINVWWWMKDALN